MTTVINSPGTGEGAGVGIIVAVLIVVVGLILFFIYGLPAIRDNRAGNGTTNINVEVPNPLPSGSSGTMPAGSPGASSGGAAE